MPKFFCEHIDDNTQVISGKDAIHIIKSLRMKIGDSITLSDTYGYDYNCKINDMKDNNVFLNVVSKQKSISEPSVKVILYQGIPKGSKLELVCQKAVELGVYRIVPVLMERSVAKLENSKKIDRLQKIADEASKQSGRGMLPKVSNVMSFSDAVKEASKFDKSIFFYENGGLKTGDIISQRDKTISAFIGPEGGFSLDEVETMKKNDFIPATLGPRILRTETAPITVLSVIMYLTGNLE